MGSAAPLSKPARALGTSTFRGLLGLGLTLTLTLGSTHALAQAKPRVLAPTVRTASTPSKKDKAKASKHYAKLQKYYERGRYKKALPHARSMWRLVPNPLSAEIYATILMSPKLERACEAFEILLTAMDLPDSQKSKNMIGLLNKAGSDCDPPSGWARIVVKPEGAIVTVSGIRVLAPRTVGLSPGKHKLVVSSSGYKTSTQEIEVYSGTGGPVTVSLQREDKVITKTIKTGPDPKDGNGGTGAGGTDPNAVKKTAEPPDHTAAYVLIGTGAAAAVAGGVMFGLAVSDRNEHEQLVLDNPNPDATTQAEIDSIRDRGKSLELGGYIAGGVGVAALITGLVLLFTADEPEEVAPATSLGPMMLPRGGGISWSASF